MYVSLKAYLKSFSCVYLGEKGLSVCGIFSFEYPVGMGFGNRLLEFDFHFVLSLFEER